MEAEVVHRHRELGKLKPSFLLPRCGRPPVSGWPYFIPGATHTLPLLLSFPGLGNLTQTLRRLQLLPLLYVLNMLIEQVAWLGSLILQKHVLVGLFGQWHWAWTWASVDQRLTVGYSGDCGYFKSLPEGRKRGERKHGNREGASFPLQNSSVGAVR